MKFKNQNFQEMMGEYDKNEIAEENYRTYRVKLLKALGNIKSKLIELQKDLKEKWSKEIDNLVGI